MHIRIPNSLTEIKSGAFAGCFKLQELEIPHLVLWHTEDENYSQRKTMYMEEGRGYYNGDLHVPYDLEEIDLI